MRQQLDCERQVRFIKEKQGGHVRFGENVQGV